MSGAKSNRPGLETAIDFVRSGDTLYQKLMFRKGEKILSIYDYSKVSASDQDYKIQIQKLEQVGAEKIFSEKIREQKRRKKRSRRTTITYCKTWR